MTLALLLSLTIAAPSGDNLLIAHFNEPPSIFVRGTDPSGPTAELFDIIAPWAAKKLQENPDSRPSLSATMHFVEINLSSLQDIGTAGFNYFGENQWHVWFTGPAAAELFAAMEQHDSSLNGRGNNLSCYAGLGEKSPSCVISNVAN